MRLITHNMLKCNVRGVKNGYPLRIEAESIEEITSEYNYELIKTMLKKIDWSGFLSGGKDLKFQELDSLLKIQDDSQLEALEDENVLKIIHKLLFDIHINEGHLICPESGRKFPIKDGIPNMLLHEDEL